MRLLSPRDLTPGSGRRDRCRSRGLASLVALFAALAQPAAGSSDRHAGFLVGQDTAVERWERGGRRLDDPGLPLVEFRRARRAEVGREEGVIALVGVNVVPMDRPRVLRNRTVIVRGDRIETIGPASEVVIPDGAERIQARRRFLIPGLADMHVHTSYRAEHIYYVANGVTTIRDMWGSAGHLRFRDAVLAGEEFGAAMWVATPGFVGPNPVLDRAVVVRTAAAGRRQVRRHARAGYDFIKVHERLGGGAYDGVAAKALKMGLPVVGHVAGPTGIGRVLAGGAQTWISHLHRVFEGSGTEFFDQAPSAEAMTEMARLFGALGIANDPTLATVRYALDAAGVDAFLRRPELAYFPQWQVDGWVDWWTRYGPWRDPGGAEQALTNLQKMVEILDREGSPLVLGTDGGFVFLLPGFAIHEELELYVDAGLSPFRALRAATVAAAEHLGAGGEFGRVEEGLRADLVLLRRNPLRDIRNTRRIEGVVLRGQWLPKAELLRRLEEVPTLFD